MNLPEFNAHQESIYTKMSQRYAENGISYSPLLNQTWMLIVALRYGNQVTDYVEDLSERISTVIPSMLYNKWNIHTTIGSYWSEKEGACVSEKEKQELLSALKEECVGLESTEFEIDSMNPILWGDSVILPWIPQHKSYIDIHTWLSLNSNIRTSSYRKGWWAHITTARFSQDSKWVGERESVEDILRMTPPLGIIRPNALEVFSFTIADSTTLILNTHDRIPL